MARPVPGGLPDYAGRNENFQQDHRKWANMFLSEKHKKELARLDTALLEIGYELLRRAVNEEQKQEINTILESLKDRRQNDRILDQTLS